MFSFRSLQIWRGWFYPPSNAHENKHDIFLFFGRKQQWQGFIWNQMWRLCWTCWGACYGWNIDPSAGSLSFCISCSGECGGQELRKMETPDDVSDGRAEESWRASRLMKILSCWLCPLPRVLLGEQVFTMSRLVHYSCRNVFKTVLCCGDTCRKLTFAFRASLYISKTFGARNCCTVRSLWQTRFMSSHFQFSHKKMYNLNIRSTE